jgi:hypothetical protein
MFKNLGNYIYTIKNLKCKQIIYRIYYTIKKKNKSSYIDPSPQKSYPINLQDSLYSNKSYLGANIFSFLNQIHRFQEKINWDYAGYGELWAYNLNYFEFLNQPEMDVKTGLGLMHDFIDQHKNLSIGYDSYPISLRNIFWIRFITKHSIQDSRIDAFLYATYKLLARNLEYHLLGNHLLENAFSLLFGACYFHDVALYQKAHKLLMSELHEQILSDGAHFELSSMYHQIILYRLLDSINLLQNNPIFIEQEKLLSYLKEKSLSMLQWLNAMTFSDGEIPLVNDAVPGIAPSTEQLNQYAIDLKVITQGDIDQRNPLRLSESGYRCFKNDVYECMLDIGQIGPIYQSGHAHADTLNFVLNVHNIPVIVDTGVSTYNQGTTRLQERGTAAHNTVAILGRNSSEIWSSFRVARRANVEILEDKEESIVAQHDGYEKMGTIHKRQWKFFDNKIEIVDSLIGKVISGKFYLHIATKYKPEMRDGIVNIGNTCISFENFGQIEIVETKLPNGYNQFKENSTIEISFEKCLKTYITIIN